MWKYGEFANLEIPTFLLNANAFRDATMAPGRVAKFGHWTHAVVWNVEDGEDSQEPTAARGPGVTCDHYCVVGLAPVTPSSWLLA